MMDSRRRHGCRANFAVGGEHLLDRAERSASKLACHSIGTVKIGIDDAHQPNGFALLLEFSIDSGVVASEDAHTNYRDGDRIVSLQLRSSRLAGCQQDSGIVNVKLGKEHGLIG